MADLRVDLVEIKEESDSGKASSRPAGSSLDPARLRVRRRVARGAASVVGALGVAAAAWWFTQAPRPHVTGMRQITTDGRYKSRPVTDGTRLYFQVWSLRGSHETALAQVAVSGGETVQLAPAGPDDINDIDLTGTQLLVNTGNGTADGPLAVRPVLGGSPRAIGGLSVVGALHWAAAAWSPDMSSIAFAKGAELQVASSDGTGSRMLVRAPGPVTCPRWSPDGQRLRSVGATRTSAIAIWEVHADGTNVRQLLEGWKGADNPRCGCWTPDGRYYVFEASGNIWALSEPRPLRRTPTPVQLTFGPLTLSRVMPSRDGKRLFAVGDQENGRSFGTTWVRRRSCRSCRTCPPNILSSLPMAAPSSTLPFLTQRCGVAPSTAPGECSSRPPRCAPACPGGRLTERRSCSTARWDPTAQGVRGLGGSGPVRRATDEPSKRAMRHGHQTAGVCCSRGRYGRDRDRASDCGPDDAKGVGRPRIERLVVGALVAGWPPHRRDAARSTWAAAVQL